MDISVISAQNRLESLQAKARSSAVAADPELQSQLARFLCVLASGLIEQGVKALLEEYVRARSAPRIYRYAAHQISRLQNAKFEDILQLIGRFDPAWRSHLEDNMSEQTKSAIDSIVNNRNQIAHGRQVNISLGTFSEYYSQLKNFMVYLEDYLAAG